MTGTAVCHKSHVRWCERGEFPPYSIFIFQAQSISGSSSSGFDPVRNEAVVVWHAVSHPISTTHTQAEFPVLKVIVCLIFFFLSCG